MPYNLLLLPLLGGFIFFHLTHYFRFSAQRLDGYRLLFQAAIAGTCLAILARLITVPFDGTPIGNLADRYWVRFAPFENSGTSTLSLALSPLLAWAINAFIDREHAKDIEIRRHGNSLIKLLHRAQKEKLLISVTLDSRKWYVGWVAESPNLDPQELYFRLLPLTSGYRDEKLEPVRTVYYRGVLEDPALDPANFFITLPLRDIKIINLFNEDVYDDYFAEPPPEANQDPTPSHRHHENG